MYIEISLIERDTYIYLIFWKNIFFLLENKPCEKQGAENNGKYEFVNPD